MTKQTKIILGSVVGFLVFLGIFFGTTYNKLVNLETEVETQFATIDSKLQRRYDLIPNLVNSASKFLDHEKEIIQSITDARAAVAGAQTTNEKIEASNQMESALSRLLVVHESNPEIKSDATIGKLMDELSGTENRISVERDRFNQVVGEYNKAIRKFPANIIAGMLGFEKMSAFEAVEGAEIAPQVNFD